MPNDIPREGMPSEQQDQAQGPDVQGAVETIAQWIMAQEQAGNPAAKQMKELIKQFVQLMMPQGEEEGPPTEQGPEAPKEEPVERSANANSKSSRVM